MRRERVTSACVQRGLTEQVSQKRIVTRHFEPRFTLTVICAVVSVGTHLERINTAHIVAKVERSVCFDAVIQESYASI